MELRGNSKLAITYADDLSQDGACSQLLRIYGIYAISRFLGIPYVHSPIAHLGYHGLSALENDAPVPGLLERYNQLFRIPSDLELPEKRSVHTMNEADLEAILRLMGSAAADFHLIRICQPYPITERYPETYRFVQPLSPFPRVKSDVFRLAIHVRRGELFAVDSHWMLPNSYYVQAALRFERLLKKLGIPFVCELYTEVPTKAFEVTPQHHGIHGRISQSISIDPALNYLEDFDAVPRLEKFVNLDPIESLHRMATADALIVSHSTFSLVPAILNADGIVIYHPFWRAPMKEWLVAGDDGAFSERALEGRLKRWHRASTASHSAGTPAPHPELETEKLLAPFRAQSAPIRSIAAVGFDLPPGMAGYQDPAGAVALLVLPARLIDDTVGGDAGFRAVAVLLPKELEEPYGAAAWKLRRTLFDRGLICIGALDFSGHETFCFLAGEAIRNFNLLDVEPRGCISMATFLDGAGFANQLWRYLTLKLYALRHGLTPALPAWQGNNLYGLDDPSSEGLALPNTSYAGFADNDRELWEKDDPPIDFDLGGYFQEIPECWRCHRPLLRNMFQLSPQHQQAIDAWRDRVTQNGCRTLVAISVRRGDYRGLQGRTMPWFRLVPEAWYLAWLRAIWPTLRDPVLFVGTDEPDAIKPVFGEFEQVSATFGPDALDLPEHICDFEVMRRADYLALSNSSFPRMASLLAHETQQCVLPSFQTQSFAPYQPWMDPAFWSRFADAWRIEAPAKREPPAVQAANPPIETTAANLTTMFFDVSDLLLYLLHQATLSGIQRVECEILSNLIEIAGEQILRFAVFDKRGSFCAIETSAFLNVIENLRSGVAPRPAIETELLQLLDDAIPCTPRPRDVFLTLGAFWNVTGMGAKLQQLKNSGVITGVFVHDIIPIAAPEFFEATLTSAFVKRFYEALTFADFVFTTSEYNKATLAKHIGAAALDAKPVQVVRLGDGFSPSAPGGSKRSAAVAALLNTRYVLCVGTIEVRKNPAYLFHIWKMLVRSGRADIPTLLFAGRRGWLVQDFLHQLKACDYLGGRIVLVHDASDVDLDELYRNSLLTMFPSFAEGWGLPVGESLSRGKVCLCSDGGGIPEAGGNLVDYIDPYNVRDGLERLTLYLDCPERRREREREIAEKFAPRSWRQTAEDLFQGVQKLVSQTQPAVGATAILLPAGRYLPISNDPPAVLMDQFDGRLSADLACVSGWHPPEITGARAAQAATAIRFRTALPPGARINLVMRLAAFGRDFRLRLRSGSGAQAEVKIPLGTEKLAVLPCSVEPGQLVTAELVSIGATLTGNDFLGASWMLQGILYFDPKLPAQGPPRAQMEQPPAPPPEPPAATPTSGPLALHAMSLDESRRANSLATFLQTPNCNWPMESTLVRAAPVFGDDADRDAFYSGCGKSDRAPRTGTVLDSIKLTRRSHQFVSTSRFSEGTVFDRLGVWKALGYLLCAPQDHTPWRRDEAEGRSVGADALAAAPFHPDSVLIFYNGNLHNYYHWVVEGLVSLDVLSRNLGQHSKLSIVMPKSVEIAECFDHRESLRAVGLDGYQTIETAADFIRVGEAFWVDSDDIGPMPAQCLKDFRQRVAALHAEVRGPRNKRLLVARKGPTRIIDNQDEVEGLLSRYGFETVYLEAMSVSSQIQLFQRAEFVIGPHGAGLSNLLFCEPGTKVIEFSPSVEFRSFFWLISQKLDLVYGLQFCPCLGPQEFQSSIHVDVAKLHKLLEAVEASSQSSNV